MPAIPRSGAHGWERSPDAPLRLLLPLRRFKGYVMRKLATVVAGVVLTAGLVFVAGPAEARKLPPKAPSFPGYTCSSVYSGGGWIAYCW